MPLFIGIGSLGKSRTSNLTVAAGLVTSISKLDSWNVVERVDSIGWIDRRLDRLDRQRVWINRLDRLNR